MIRFDNVVKKFGDHVVLDELDFTVDRGEKVTLIGPSGSGKTTILRLLMTLEKMTEGDILVDGVSLNQKEKSLREVRKRIGMVFQQFNLFPNMDVLSNITEAPVHVLGQSRGEARTRGNELLEMVGLSDKAHAHPSQLSGGQQQRVAIARCLAMNPEVMLLDEVTSALDPELVDDVLSVLRDIATSTDITMLIVTHEMRFAREVSDRVMMFDAGRIAETGPPAQIFEDPHSDRTRAFLKAVL
ncbi:ectoine/hydroxyectoine ABC transporter ATP-binding protein EhuA [Gordonia sp. (in: high G+C Gram-positive bacteria)]|uniref:ectoine/hydroxyectoine ABC transporter ATP-binding protein EhuA n=1 Tax=Gordonia sp. (in: high G+C Gram-positive bacteria) TaxID=84139 RepID=UPI003F975EC2